MGGSHRNRGSTDIARGTRHRARLILVLLAATCVVVSVLVLRTMRIADLRREIARLEHRHAMAIAEQQRLEELLLTVRDPEVIEDLARRWLGLVYPGEEKAIFIHEE
ncbi:MAG: septum formation initiator family protein [Candidatus Bipolaricaulota bacterium]|nr:MAG: septum formation initiator family protein [Candidatus Bipolaricaulota bacterium]